MKYSIEKTSLFDKWLSKIKDRAAKKAILMRIMRAENGNFGDIKSVGTPVQEMRIFVSKGYRIYFTLRNKGTQQQDIEKAHKLLIEQEG